MIDISTPQRLRDYLSIKAEQDQQEAVFVSPKLMDYLVSDIKSNTGDRMKKDITRGRACTLHGIAFLENLV